MFFPHFFGESQVIMDGLFDFVAVVKVVGKRGMNFGEGELVITSDLVSAHAHALVPDGDIHNADAVAGDTRLAAEHAGRDFNELI